MTKRPAANGLAMSQPLFTNCNVLNASNTQNLNLTVPKIMPNSTNTNIYNMMIGPSQASDQSFYQEHPNYLNVACLPFAQQYYSLDTFNQLRYPERRQISTTASSPDLEDKGRYKSAFSEQEERDRRISLGKKLLTFAHFDL